VTPSKPNCIAVMTEDTAGTTYTNLEPLVGFSPGREAGERHGDSNLQRKNQVLQKVVTCRITAQINGSYMIQNIAKPAFLYISSSTVRKHLFILEIVAALTKSESLSYLPEILCFPCGKALDRGSRSHPGLSRCPPCYQPRKSGPLGRTREQRLK